MLQDDCVDRMRGGRNDERKRRAEGDSLFMVLPFLKKLLRLWGACQVAPPTCAAIFLFLEARRETFHHEAWRVWRGSKDDRKPRERPLGPALQTYSGVAFPGLARPREGPFDGPLGLGHPARLRRRLGRARCLRTLMVVAPQERMIGGSNWAIRCRI